MQSHAVKDFLGGNLIPFQWLDVLNEPEAKELMELASISDQQLPAVFFEDGSCLVNPSAVELGEKIGLRSKAAEKMYDVTIVGAGPAGMAAAVYGGSEGLKKLRSMTMLKQILNGGIIK